MSFLNSLGNALVHTARAAAAVHAAREQEERRINVNNAAIASNARMIAQNEALIARNNALLGDYSPSRLSAHAAPMSMTHADKINDFRMQYATLAVEVRKQEQETGYTNYRAASAMRQLNTAITDFISVRQDSLLAQNYEREVQASLQKVTAIILA